MDADLRTPIERRIQKSFEDTAGHGKPLSRRARQTKRTVEAYLQAGVIPRYMERLNEIDSGLRTTRLRLARSYAALREACGDDTELFAARWRERVHSWPFEPLNALIREHNEWYPLESGLPLDPRTGDYIRRAGRSYRREEIGPDWALERFPA
ncbi:MAG: hypothetical protein M3340_11615 [Actinomycetota bacterium]|nr:hypothetical protein [Actinomycetota bacterium]